MFDKDDKAIKLAFSLSSENDKRIVSYSEDVEAERLHRMAINPDKTIRNELGIPLRGR